jgi:hypothetical protein
MFRAFFSRKPDAPHPLVDLVSIRASIPSSPRDRTDLTPISCIPLPNWGFLTRIPTDLEFISTFHVKYDRSSLEKTLALVNAHSVNSDVLSIALLYHCFVFLYSETNGDVSDHLLCQQAINVVDAKDFAVFRNLAFRMELDLIISQKFNASAELFQAVLWHFQMNEMLDASFFAEFSQICTQIVASGDSRAFDWMVETCLALIDGNHPMIEMNGFSDLILIFQPALSELHPKALHFLAVLSTKAVDLPVHDPFWLVTAGLGKVLREEKPKRQFVNKPDLDEEIVCDFEIPFEFVATEFCGSFDEMPDDALKDTIDVMDILGERARSAIAVVSGCLQECSPNAREAFFASSIDFFKFVGGEPNLLVVIGAFLSIYETILDKDSLGRLLPVLANTRIFAAADTVFNDESIDLGTNTIRKTIFEMVVRLAPELAFLLLNSFAENPLIMTEFLARALICHHGFDIGTFIYDRHLRLIFNGAMILQRMKPSRRIHRCRSVLFVVLRELALAHGFFQSAFFTSHFLWFMFERRVAGFVLDTLTHWLAKVNTESHVIEPANYILMVLEACLSRSYADLAEGVLEAVVSGLRQHWIYASAFSKVLPVCLRFAQCCQSLSLFCNTLRFLVILSFHTDRFELSLPLTRSLWKCCQAVTQSDPPPEVECLLFALLASSFNFQELVLIAVPSAIPLILASFGASRRIGAVLGKFRFFVRTTNHNRRMAQKGFLDLILASYLSSKDGVVHFAPDFSFPFSGPITLCEELLSFIAEAGSSEAVCRLLADGISNESDVNYIMKILARARRLCDRPHFPVGQLTSQFSVEGFSAQVFAASFSISFQLSVDLTMASLSDCPAQLITLTDTVGSFFCIYLYRSVIAAAHQAGCRRTTVPLIRSLSTTAFCFYDFTFRQSPGHCRIGIQQDGYTHNESDLCEFQFQEGPVCISVGGSEHADGTEVGILTDLQVWTGIAPATRRTSESLLLSSNWVKEPGIYAVHEVGKLTLSVNESKALPPNFLDAFVNSTQVNALACKFQIPGILSVIEILFGFAEKPQIDFEMVGFLAESLIPSASLYFSLYGVLTSISLHDLQIEWLEKLIINCGLWTKCPLTEFGLILRHWTVFVINAFSPLFEERKFFLPLLREYYGLFCGATIPFGAGRPPNQIEKCSDLFALFLIKVGSISLGPDDLAEFCRLLTMPQSKESLLKMLSMLLEMSHFLSVEIDPDGLFPLMCGDPDVDAKVIHVIHEYRHSDVCTQMVAISERIESVVVFDRLLSSYADFPRTLPLLCLLALKFGLTDRLVAGLVAVPDGRFPFWYTFPILAMVNASDPTVVASLCGFIIGMMDWDTELAAIVVCIRFLEPHNLASVFLQTCFAIDKHPALAEVCVDTALFHFHPRTYHDFVVEEFRREGILWDFVPTRLTPISDISAIARCDWTQIPVGFEFRLDENRTWGDRNIVQIALCLLDAGSPLQLLVWFFKDKTALSDEQLEQISIMIDELIQARLARHRALVEDLLSSLCCQMKEYLLAVKGGALRKPVIPPPPQIDRSSLPAEKRQLWTPEWKRDLSLCLSFVPMKRKWSRRPWREKPRVEIVDPIFESPAERVKSGRSTTVAFALMKHLFAIDGVPVQLNEIRYILGRSRSHGETAVEFVLSNGHALLLDFHPVENMTIIEFFEAFQLKYAKVIPRAIPGDALCERWVQGYRSNFDYMMRLDFLSLSFHESHVRFFSHYQDLLIEGDFEAAYRRRKAIESEEFSESLPFLIDKAFGCTMADNGYSRRLFGRPHPLRAPFRQTFPASQTLQLIQGSTVAFGCVYRACFGRASLNLITSEGESIRFLLDFTHGLSVSSEVVGRLPQANDCCMSSFKSHVIALNVRTRALVHIRRGEVEESSRLYSDTNHAVCCDCGWVIFCATATDVRMRSANGHDRQRVCCLDYPALRIAANPSFKMFAVATLSGKICVHSMRSGALVNEVDIGQDVLEMVITPRMALVVYFIEGWVGVLSVNGERIKRVEWKDRASKVFALRSEHDFDFVVVHTPEQELELFEAFHPEKVIPLGKVPEEVMTVAYSPTIGSLLIVTITGRLVIQRQSLDTNAW